MVRNLRSSLYAALAAVLLTACGPGNSSNSDPDQEDSVAAPEIGACRELAAQDLGLPTNTTRTVECSEAHTAETIAVGVFPSNVDTTEADGTDVANYAYDACAEAFARHTGADESLAMRTLLSWVWFRPSEEAWEAGARWYRCDLVGGSGTRPDLVNLPTSTKGMLTERNIDAWLSCVDAATVVNADIIACTQDHEWRAVTTIRLGADSDAYPGDAAAAAKSEDFCSDSVAAWLNYPADFEFAYTVFGQAEWDNGNRRSICWARTTK